MNSILGFADTIHKIPTFFADLGPARREADDGVRLAQRPRQRRRVPPARVPPRISLQRPTGAPASTLTTL